MNRRRRIVVRRDGNRQAFDESAESLSFARPAPVAQRQILVPHTRRRIDPPMISPVNSEVSMPDSLGEAPSLVSDSGSHLSNSSPTSYVQPQRRLPMPEPPPLSDAWRPDIHNSAFSNDAHRGPEYSIPIWSQLESPKQSAQTNPASSQRLYQFAEVASVTPPYDSTTKRFTPSQLRTSLPSIPTFSEANEDQRGSTAYLRVLPHTTAMPAAPARTQLSDHGDHWQNPSPAAPSLPRPSYSYPSPAQTRSWSAAGPLTTSTGITPQYPSSLKRSAADVDCSTSSPEKKKMHLSSILD